MREDLETKTYIYKAAEIKWRNRSFRLALLLGCLPILAGMGVLLPEALTPWWALMIAVINVTVVVVQVKMDMGERIAQASTVGKGYDKVCTQITVFIAQSKLMPNPPEVQQLLTQIPAMVEMIENTIGYPEVTKPTRGTKPGAANASFLASWLPCLPCLGKKTASLNSLPQDPEAGFPSPKNAWTSKSKDLSTDMGKHTTKMSAYIGGGSLSSTMNADSDLALPPPVHPPPSPPTTESVSKPMLKA